MSRFVYRFAAGFMAVASTILITAGVSVAADYPARPVTLVVPYPPGGGVDAMARVVAAKLSDALHQQFIVDNRAGAGGTIGTRAVAQAAPDGYTLLLGHTGTISINPTLYTHAGYDPRKNFAPIGLVASMPVALLAHPSFPAKSIGEFIAMAKKDPGKLNLGTSAPRRSAPAAICAPSCSSPKPASTLPSFPTRAPRR
jgi:tripartite-type tricarboxylate transporter receptor subunit TctC